MRKDDLMKPDVFSEIILVGSSIVLFLPILMLIVSAFMSVTQH